MPRCRKKTTKSFQGCMLCLQFLLLMISMASPVMFVAAALQGAAAGEL
jgi:hypothetical protein